MTKQMEDLQGYVNDMLAVETELHEAFRRQKADARLKKFPAAQQLISRAEDTVDVHLAKLRECLKRMGSDESVLKKAVGGVLGAAAGVYDKLRSDDKVSRMLRDDHTALSFASVCYEMLYTTALAMHDSATADLALDHLKEVNTLVVEVNDLIPRVLIEELSSEGKITFDAELADDVVRHTREAWYEASAST